MAWPPDTRTGPRRRPGRLLAASALAAATLAGCATAPPRRIEVAPAVPGSQTAAIPTTPGAAWPEADWWRLAADPGLDRLMAQALAAAPGLDAAAARVARARAVLQSTGAGTGPGAQLDLTIAHARISESGMAPPNFRGTWDTNGALGVGFGWVADFWGVRRATTAAAEAGTRLALAEQAAARLALEAGIVRAWAGLARAEALVTGAREGLAGRETILELQQARNAAGIPAAVQRARQAVAEARRDLEQRQLAVRTLRLQLAALAGLPPEAATTIPSPDLPAVAAVAVPTSVPLDLVSRRPDVLAAAARIGAARHQEAAARGAFLPNIGISGTIGLQSFGLEDLLKAGSFAPSLGPALHLPLFDGGRLRGELGQRVAETDAAVASYEDTVLQALRETATALASQSAARAATVEARAQADAAGILWGQAQERFERGLISRIELLEAREAAIAAARPISEAPGRELEAAVDLVVALGGGVPPPPQVVVQR